MSETDILKSITPKVSAILKKGGYFEAGSTKDLRCDTSTKRKLSAAVESKNHKLLEDMWSKNPGLFASLPQFQEAKTNLNKTDMDRIKKEISTQPKDQKTFEKRIDKSYLTSPTRLDKIEQTEGHLSDLTNEQRSARKDKRKTKIWRTRSGRCKICAAMEGQRRKIGDPYSNGSYVAHAHPGCVCYDEYEEV